VPPHLCVAALADQHAGTDSGPDRDGCAEHEVARDRLEALPGPGEDSGPTPVAVGLGPATPGLVLRVYVEGLGRVIRAEVGIARLVQHQSGEAGAELSVHQPELLGQAQGAQGGPELVAVLALAHRVEQVLRAVKVDGATADAVEAHGREQHIVCRLLVRTLDPVGHRVESGARRGAVAQHVPVAVGVVLQPGEIPAALELEQVRHLHDGEGVVSRSVDRLRLLPVDQVLRVCAREHRPLRQLRGRDSGGEHPEKTGSLRMLDDHQVWTVHNAVRRRVIQSVVPAGVGRDDGIAKIFVPVRQIGAGGQPDALIPTVGGR